MLASLFFTLVLATIVAVAVPIGIGLGVIEFVFRLVRTSLQWGAYLLLGAVLAWLFVEMGPARANGVLDTLPLCQFDQMKQNEIWNNAIDAKRPWVPCKEIPSKGPIYVCVPGGCFQVKVGDGRTY